MVKIRSDLEGVVYLGADALVLRAGDDVPDGYTVGDHLIDRSDDDDVPRANASREKWAAYATGLGIDVPEDAKQKDIRALVEAQG